MDEYRCKSYSDGRMEIERYSYSGNKHTWENPSLETSSNNSNNNNNNNDYNNGVVFQDIRSYSTSSYATSVKSKELRKDKRANGSFTKAAWCFGDPEMQRKKRVASYKSFSVEDKLKRSFSKSFKWIKDRYSHVVHGY